MLIAKCSKCGIVKEATEFPKNPHKKNGLSSHCKACHKLWVQTHPELTRAAGNRYRDKQRQLRPPRTRTTITSLRNGKYRDTHPERYAANTAINNAIKLGRIVPEPCFCCGKKGHAHHASYSPDMRLAVTWLCTKHHKLLHQETN